MAQRSIIPGIVFDDDMENGWVRIGPYLDGFDDWNDYWIMSEDQYFHLLDGNGWEEVALFLSALSVGLWRLPDEYVAP